GGLVMATPCDPVETVAVVRFLCDYHGPAYLRLGKAGEAVLHSQPILVEGPSFPQLRDGSGVAVIACGSIAAVWLPTGERLAGAVYSAALWSGDEQTVQSLIELVERYERLIVIEEHVTAGGFGSFVRECLESRPDLQSRVRIIALRNKLAGIVGSQEFL